MNDVTLLLNRVRHSVAIWGIFSAKPDIRSIDIILKIMKNLLYVIAGLLIVLWAIIFLSFNSSALVHWLLAIAAILILVGMSLGKHLSSK